MSNDLIELLKQRLAVFAPIQLVIHDDSAAHSGHKGNTLAGSHFELAIASTQFDQLSTLNCHRLIYQKVADLIPYPIHALSIKIIR